MAYPVEKESSQPKKSSLKWTCQKLFETIEKQVLWQRPWSCASHLMWDKEPTWLYPPYEILTNQEDQVDVPNSWNKSNLWPKKRMRLDCLDHESQASNFCSYAQWGMVRFSELGHWGGLNTFEASPIAHHITQKLTSLFAQLTQLTSCLNRRS